MKKTIGTWLVNITFMTSLATCSTTVQAIFPNVRVKHTHASPTSPSNKSIAEKYPVTSKDTDNEQDSVATKDSVDGKGQALKRKELAQSQIKNWRISGKIAIQTSRQSGTANVNWTERANQYYVSMIGPVGVGAIALYGRPGKVILRTGNGKTFVDRSPEHLLAKGWGYNLPLSHLKYWIRGLPSPNLSMSTRYDNSGRLRTLIQQGWVIQYLGYTRHGKYDLPNKIFIRSPSLQVKIVIYQWQV